jgi:hypothetical protein
MGTDAGLNGSDAFIVSTRSRMMHGVSFSLPGQGQGMAIKIVLGTMEEHHVLSGQLGSYMGSVEWIYLERIAFAVRPLYPS